MVTYFVRIRIRIRNGNLRTNDGPCDKLESTNYKKKSMETQKKKKEERGKKKKEEEIWTKNRDKEEGWRMRLQPQDPRPTPVSDPTSSGAWTSRCSERPEYNMSWTDTDTCIPVATQTTEGEREVPTTQSRLTPSGQEQKVKVTTRFTNLRTQVSSKLDAVRRNVMNPKPYTLIPKPPKDIDCPVQGCLPRILLVSCKSDKLISWRHPE
jgi:hypothetical protein